MKILKNNFYILKLCFKAAPLYMCMALFASVLEYVVSTVISIYFMRFIVESMQQNRPFREVFVLIIIMFFVGLISRILDSYVYNILQPLGRIKITALFMEMLYKQAVSVDISCYENPEFYDSYTKANEQVQGYADQIMRTLTWVAGVLASMVISVSVIIMYEPWVIIIAIIPVLVEQLLVKKYSEYKFNRDKDTAFERRQMEYVNRTVYLQEYAKEIRLSHIFTPILNSFNHAMENMRETSKAYGKKIGVVRFFRTILSELLVYLCVQCLVVYQYLVKSAYTFGNLTVLLNSVSEFTSLLGQFSWARNNIYECGMFIENFRVFMEYKTKIPENEQGITPNTNNTDIVLKNVGFTYEGSKKPVLHNVTMTIKKGERIAIVGHNGAGKSTLVKLLMRLYDVTEGAITVGGTDIRTYRLSEYRNLYGAIFQDFKIFAGSVLENVLLHGDITEEDRLRAQTALKESGIYEKLASLPNGIDSQLTKEFAKDGIMMSGGEYQKLAIARVFAKESEICILDEPSSALDPLSEYEVFQNMLKACQGKTVIFISHRLASTVMADRIYMFEEGRIIEAGNHEELMKLNGKYANMYHVQAKRYKEEAAYEV